MREFIIYLPNSEKYLSPNRFEYLVSEAPDDLLGNYAMFIDNKLDYYFSEITQSVEDFSKIKKNIQVSIPKNLKRVKITENRSYSGYWAIINRNYIYLSENEQTDFLIDYFTINGLNDKKVIKYNIENFNITNNPEDDPLTIKSSILTKDLIEKKDGFIYLKLGKVIGLQSNLFNEKTRTNPIEINFPNSYKYKIELEIPKGYRIIDYDRLIESKKYVSVDGDLGALFNSEVNIEKNKLHVTIEEYYKQLRYEKKRYEEFRNVINAAAKFYDSSVILEKI